jgi:ribosomal protein S18 acetylase RimI-like enzyme
MGAKIRDAILEDYKYIKILINQVHNLHYSNRPDIYINTSEPLNFDEYKSILNDNKKIKLIAEYKDKAVGFCIVTIKGSSENLLLVPRKIAYMETLCVHQDYRRRGIGRLLFNEALKRVKLFDADSLELMVWSFNESAIRFYKNMGMKSQYLKMEMKIE